MKRGFTLIELMVVMIVMSLLMAALYKVFFGANRGAREIIENHGINDEMDRTVQKITDDVRESNYIFENCPKSVNKSQINALKTEDADNYLMFMKVNFDFTKDPSTLPVGEYNYTQTRIKYFLEREEPGDMNSPWTLCREMLPFDNRRTPMPSEKTILPVLTKIDECIFYRLNDPDSAGSGNLFIKLAISRQGKVKKTTSKYQNQLIISVKERGAAPE
jgi:prepilin-type N-terminal cleavage/methylation domain-containing protein